MPKPYRVAIVAGEISGDILGAGLLKALKAQQPNLIIEGIGGPLMQAAGLKPLFSFERMGSLGIIEAIKLLPQLWFIRQKLIRYLISQAVDVYIGIDFSEFNISVENRLKRAGIKTVHYNSPKVWAWRQNRIYKIARSVDMMLTLLPFEAKFYQQHNIPVRFVGHPLADEIPVNLENSEFDQNRVREELSLQKEAEIVALLPGSRKAELSYLASTILKTAQWCLQQRANIQFIMAAVNEARAEQFKSIWQSVCPSLPIKIFVNQARKVISAANVVLLASGTATLETMLLKKPMVVGYRASKLTAAILRRLVKIDKVALPNLLADKFLVPELLQENFTPEKMGKEVLKLLDEPEHAQALQQEFQYLHELVRKNSSQQAADAVLDVIA